MSPSQAPFIHLGTSAFIGTVPVQIPDLSPFIIWVEPILSLTFVRELDREWLVVSMLHVLRFLGLPKFLDLLFRLWLHISL
jgi:hypothetical protein